MARTKDNHITFTADDTQVTSLNFSYSGNYDITSGGTFDGVDTTGADTTVLDVDADASREASEPPADWYCNQVNNNSSNMIHTAHGDFRPQELNFAFTGTLTINGTNFEVCLGQGSYNMTNNWHLCSEAIVADDDHKGGTLTLGSTQYYLQQDGDSGFKVTKK